MPKLNEQSHTSDIVHEHTVAFELLRKQTHTSEGRALLTQVSEAFMALRQKFYAMTDERNTLKRRLDEYETPGNGKFCSSCGYDENPPTALYCSACGSEIRENGCTCSDLAATSCPVHSGTAGNPEEL